MLTDKLLLDKIFEASVVPELWRSLLVDIANKTGSFGGALISFEPNGTSLWFSGYRRFVATDTYDPVLRQPGDLIDYENPRVTRAITAKQWFFQSDLQLCSLDELKVDRIYQELLHPLGIGWTIGCPIPVPSAPIVVFEFCRTIEAGPFEDPLVSYFNDLRPDLARAAFIAARLGLERSRSAVETLSSLDLPGAALTASGRVVFANREFEALSPRLQMGAADKLIGASPGMTSQIATFFNDVRGRAGSSRSFPLPRSEDGPPLILHLLPIRRAAEDVFSPAEFLLVVTPILARRTELSNLIEGLFDFTPAEMMLARGLLDGETLTSYARRRRISKETARTQLTSLLGKTGTHRQLDLVRLLASASLN
jgi:DNA-binding CsgD family transcriptional regulator